jgi:hypothetical protein
VAGEQADQDQQALAAVGTRLASPEGWTPGGGWLALWFRGGRRGVGGVPGQPALELVPQGPMEWTPQPIVADLVESLGSHVRQEAANKLLGGQGHGVPTMVLGVLVAEADVAVLDRDHTAIGQGDPVDISA